MFKKRRGQTKSNLQEIYEPFPEELKDALEEWAAKNGRDLEKLIKNNDKELKWYIRKWRLNTWRDKYWFNDDPEDYKVIHMIVRDREKNIIYDLSPTRK